MHEAILKLVSDIVNQVDYDIWKQSYNPDTAECSPDDVEENLEELAALVIDRLDGVFEQARLFDALVNQERIIVSDEIVGQEKYQRMTIEMWTHHLSSASGGVKNETSRAVNLIREYLSVHADSLEHGYGS